ncbi:hypothetical protein PG988_004897 [Apiospora saccharicola]
MAPLRIASLGSSFAAGPGIPPVSDAKAGRSGANYARLLAARLDGHVALTDLASSISTPPSRRKLRGLPADTDVVLIFGGGNDIGYIGGLFMDSFDAYWFLRVTTYICRWFYPLEPDKEQLDVEALAARYGEVLDAIHARAPGACVLVIEYLTVVGDHVRPGVDVPFDGGKLVRYRDVAEQVRVATVKAVQGREKWCVQVPVVELSAEHGMGAEQAWVSGWSWRLLFVKGVYHPNAEGMAAVADIIHGKMRDLGIAATDDA